MSIVLQFTNPQFLFALLLALSAASGGGHIQPTAGAPSITVPVNLAQLQQQCINTGGAPFIMRQEAVMRAMCVTMASAANVGTIKVQELGTNVLWMYGSADQVAQQWQILFPNAQAILTLAQGDLDIPNPFGNIETSEYWTDESPAAPDCGNNLYYVVSMYFKSRDQFEFCVKKVVSQQEVVTAALRKMWDAGIQMAIKVGGGYYIIEPGAVTTQGATEAMLKNPNFARAVFQVLVELSQGIANDPQKIQVLWGIAPFDAFPSP